MTDKSENMFGKRVRKCQEKYRKIKQILENIPSNELTSIFLEKSDGKLEKKWE